MTVEALAAGDGRWDELVDAAPTFMRRLADDPLVASLLVVHGLHPDGLRQRVAAALEKVRPFLGGHGGDVELLDVDEDVGVRARGKEEAAHRRPVVVALVHRAGELVEVASAPPSPPTPTRATRTVKGTQLPVPSQIAPPLSLHVVP